MSSTTDDRDQRLQEAIAAFLDAAGAGEVPARAQLLAAHPDLADDLSAFLADHDRMTAAVAPVRDKLVPGGNGTAEAPAKSSAESFPQQFGDYELLEEIGRGGMGIVYKARQISLHRIVALKRIRAGQLASAEEVARFRQEAEAAARLDHPHIVPILEVGEHAGQHYFTMKLIEGGNLNADLDQYADAKASAGLMTRIARAVHHAHQRGILHRDLKPGNILLDTAGQPHISDFGLAQPIEKEARLTQSGAIVGTAEYMAPEQARGDKGLTTAADVYGLGAILYVLLTGRPPFQGDYNWETLRKVVEEEPPLPRSLNRKANHDLETISLKCLAKQPAQRYGSAEALAEDLQRWLDGKPIQARRATIRERVWKGAKRRPAVAALLVVSVTATLLLLGVGSVLLLQLREALAEANSQGERLADQNQKLEDLASALKKESAAGTDALEQSRSNLFTSQLLRADALQILDPKQALDLLHDYEVCPINRRDAAWRFLARSCQRRLESTLIGREEGTGLRYYTDRVPTADGKLCAVLRRGETDKTVVMDLVNGHIQKEEVKGKIVGELTSDGKISWHLHPQVAETLGPLLGGIHLRLHDLETGHTREVKLDLAHRTTLKYGGKQYYRSMSPDGKTLAESSWGGVWLFSADTGKELAEVLPSDKGNLVGTTFSPDGQLFAVAGPIQGHGRGVLLLETRTGKVVRFIPHALDRVHGSLCFSHDGQILALVQVANASERLLKVSLFDIPTGKTRHCVQIKVGGLHALPVFSRDDRYFAVGIPWVPVNPEPSVHVWDVRQGKEVRTLRDQAVRWNRLAFSYDGLKLVLSGEDKIVKVWDFHGGTSYVLPALEEASWASVTSDNKLLVVSPRGVHSWNLDPPGPIASFASPGTGPELNGIRNRVTVEGDEKWRLEGNGVYWSPYHRHLAVRSRNEMRVFEVLTGKECLRLKDTLRDPLFLPDCRHLICECYDLPSAEGPYLWSLETGQQIDWPQEYKGLGYSERMTKAMQGLPKGNAGADGEGKGVRGGGKVAAKTIGSWSRDRRSRVSKLLAVTPDCQSLVEVRYDDGVLQLVDLPTGRVRAILSGAGPNVIGARFNGDGTLLATWDEAGTVRVLDLQPPLEYARFAGMSLAFSPDGSKLVVTDNWRHKENRPLVQLVDLATGQSLATANDEEDFLANLERFPVLPPLFPTWQGRDESTWWLFTPDRKIRVHVGPQRITVADVSGEKVTVSLPVDIDPVAQWLPFDIMSNKGREALTSMVLSPDGQWLAYQTSHDEVKLGSLTGKGWTTLASDGGLAFSPDSKILAYRTNKGYQFLDLATGKSRRPFVNELWGHLAFSPDGKTLATVLRGVVQLWDIESGKMRASLPAQPGQVFALAFSPDGRFLGAGYGKLTFQNEVVIWDLSRLRSMAGGVP